MRTVEHSVWVIWCKWGINDIHWISQPLLKDAACTIPIDWSCFAAELQLTYQACESQESADSIQCLRVILAIALPLYLMGVKIAILLFLKTQLQNWGHSHAAAPKWLTSNSNSLVKSNSLFMTFLLPNSVYANCSDVNCPLQGWWWPMLSSPCCVALHWQNIGKTLGKHWENIGKHWQKLAKHWITLAKHWQKIPSNPKKSLVRSKGHWKVSKK